MMSLWGFVLACVFFQVSLQDHLAQGSSTLSAQQMQQKATVQLGQLGSTDHTAKAQMEVPAGGATELPALIAQGPKRQQVESHVHLEKAAGTFLFTLFFIAGMIQSGRKMVNAGPLAGSGYISMAAASGEEAAKNAKDTFPTPFQRTLITMYVASFFLGPLLDNYHGLFGTLTYEDIGLPFQLSVNGQVLLQSAAWVPIVFGGAGVIMTWLLKVLDDIFQTEDSVLSPGWSKTFTSIGFFSGQYWLSGLLDHLAVPCAQIHFVLAVFAIGGWAAFDGSVAGALLGLATAIAGLITEVGLTSLDVYHYTNADFFGVCSWIPWVYFLGAPAVGNLAREVFKAYQARAR